MMNNLLEATNSDVLSKRDLVIGTVIALAMGTTFTLLSSGMSLLVTFVPGVILSWLTYVWLFVTKTKLPNGSAFLPVFFTLLSVQFIHFAEEFMTGFRAKFPSLYGGISYSDNFFVTFNMIAYFVFALLFRQPCMFVHRFHSFIKTEISAKPRFRSPCCGSESNVLLASISFFL